MKRILPLMALGLLAGCLIMFRGEGFEKMWRKVLVVSVPLNQADALIVLGGEPLARPLEAARLYREGIAPKVFVTGTGDASRCRKVLTGAGVPARDIVTEPKATTTYTNATLLKPMLEETGIRSALIVTSPFHTRRALATFRKVMPGIRFGVTDASIEWWKTSRGKSDINRFALIEFLKTAEYWLIYGVKPWGTGSQGGK